MKASPADQKLLLRVQELDTALLRIGAEEKNPPQAVRLRELTASSDALVRRSLGESDELAAARLEMTRAESDVGLVEARMRRDTERSGTTTAAKDAQALEAELVSLRRRRTELEDIELTVMERVETLEGRARATEGEASEIEAQMATLTKERDARLAELAAERVELDRERGGIVDSLPAELVALYDRQRERYGIGAAMLRGGVSLGSNVTLTPSELATVRAAADDDVMLDPEGGCILVRDLAS